MPMSRRTRQVTIVAALVILTPIIAVFYRVAFAVGCPDISDDYAQTRQAWNDGDLIVVMRHAEKCEEESSNCTAGNNPGLTVDGIVQAKQVGHGLDSLGPGASDTYFSPALRTAMTAHIAVGTDLTEAEWLVKDCRVDLRQKINAHKQNARNLILVTHSSCLNDLLDPADNPVIEFDSGRDENSGISLLFRDNHDQSMETIGCVLPVDWPARNS